MLIDILNNNYPYDYLKLGYIFVVEVTYCASVISDFVQLRLNLVCANVELRVFFGVCGGNNYSYFCHLYESSHCTVTI